MIDFEGKLSQARAWRCGGRWGRHESFADYLEVHGTYNLLNNCSYNPTISRVIIVMGLIFWL